MSVFFAAARVYMGPGWNHHHFPLAPHGNLLLTIWQGRTPPLPLLLLAPRSVRMVTHHAGYRNERLAGWHGTRDKIHVIAPKPALSQLFICLTAHKRSCAGSQGLIPEPVHMLAVLIFCPLVSFHNAQGLFSYSGTPRRDWQPSGTFT